MTGATGGLGRRHRRGLAGRRGPTLVVTGRRAEPLRELAAEVQGTAVVADLADAAQRDGLAGRRPATVDILVANAAVPASGELDDWDPARIDRALTINLGSPIAMTRALLPAFRARGSGHFVFVSSLSGRVGTRGASLYSATKFGLRGFAGGLRSDLHRTGIGVSVVTPGFCPGRRDVRRHRDGVALGGRHRDPDRGGARASSRPSVATGPRWWWRP